MTDYLWLLGGMGAFLWLVWRRPTFRQLAQGWERIRNATRRRESEASQQRTEADEKAIKDVMSRPHTDDPVADLRNRLGGNDKAG